MAAQGGSYRRSPLGGLAAGAALLLLLGACADPAAPRTCAHPAPLATVDLASKNLTATAYRPTIVIVTHGPASPGQPSHGGPIVDHASFVDRLRGERCTVEFTAAVRQPFLRGQPIGLRVSGCGLTQPAELQSFWYHTDDLGTDGLRAAEEDARGIGPDGQPVAATVTWVAAPHFFRKERAFVLYLGDDPALLGLLSKLLGPQFAGR